MTTANIESRVKELAAANDESPGPGKCICSPVNAGICYTGT